MREDRPGLTSCLKALVNRRHWSCGNWIGSTRPGDISQHRARPDRARHGLKVLTGHGAAIDTTTAAAGKLVFGISPPG